jgi:hypothetical protein
MSALELTAPSGFKCEAIFGTEEAISSWTEVQS